MKFRTTLAAIALMGAVVLPLGAFAQATPPQLQPSGPVQSVGDVFTIIGNIFGLLRNLFFLAAAFFVLYAAYLYLTASGDEAKLGAAKSQLIYAAVAVAVALVATGIKPFVESLLGQ